MNRFLPLLVLAGATLTAAERINHEGRILGPTPTVTTPLLFNTAAADAVVSTLQIMPRDSAWNEDVSTLPLLANSSAMITAIRADVFAGTHPDRRRVVVFKEMNYVVIPDNQARVDVTIFNYPDESDDLKVAGGSVGSWPLPSNLPIETWPSEQPGLTLLQWQQDVNHVGGDRHAIAVMPGSGSFWETGEISLTATTPPWRASTGARFSLNANTPRPAGWTSADAAGLPIFPALVRYDEVQRGTIEHAMRLVVKRSRQEYVYPASHQAGSTTLPDVPAMGQRLRLKAAFAIPASWTPEERTIAVALKKYGALVADNGNFFSLSICPDDRWTAGCFDHLSTNAGSDLCDITDFEVVAGTGPTEGPRSPGAPTAGAGIDQTVTMLGGATLNGVASGSGVQTRWSLYPQATAPGTVTFGDPTQLTTTATFSAVGIYLVTLKVTDGIHSPAYDVVQITVQPGGTPPATGSGTAASGTSGSTTGADSGGSGGGGCGLGSFVGLSLFFSLCLYGQRCFTAKRNPCFV